MAGFQFRYHLFGFLCLVTYYVSVAFEPAYLKRLKTVVNIVSILLGITISVKMQATIYSYKCSNIIDHLVRFSSTFIMDSIGGVVFAKILNLFRRKRCSRSCRYFCIPNVKSCYQNGDRQGPSNYLNVEPQRFWTNRFCYCRWIIIILHVIWEKEENINFNAEHLTQAFGVWL